MAQLADGVEQGADAFERKVFALDGDKDVVRGDEGVHGKQVESRRAIDEYPVEAFRPAVDVFFQQGMTHVLAEERFV